MDLSRHPKLPGWYVWVAVVLVPLSASFSVLVISLRANERTVEASITREREARRVSEEAFCRIIVLLDDAWRAVEPTTDSGRELAIAVRQARTDYHCQPS